MQDEMQDKNKDTSGLISALLPMQPHGTCNPERPNHLISSFSSYLVTYKRGLLASKSELIIRTVAKI